MLQLRWIKVVVLLMVLFYSTMCFSVMAQYGFRAGTTLSNFSYVIQGPDPDLSFEIDLKPYLGYDIEWVQLGNQKALFAPYIGFYYNYKLAKRFSLQPEICFNQKGVNFSQATYEKITYKVIISYLEVPVMLSYAMIKTKKIVSEIRVGLYGSLTLDARKKVESFRSGMKATPLMNTNNIISGLAFGLNFKYKIRKNFIGVDLRAFWDMNDALYIPEDQIAIYHKIQKVRNAGLHITLSYEI